MGALHKGSLAEEGRNRIRFTFWVALGGARVGIKSVMMKLCLFFSDADREFCGVDFLPEDLNEAPEETEMRVNKTYSCLPAEEKGIHIINIRAIEDIGYDQHESTVSK